MTKTAIVGVNWGDEGKGRMVDLIAKHYQYVVRYQGGNNAGHTVQNPYGHFVLNLLPSGIFNPDTVNVLGQGMVIDLAHLNSELAQLSKQGFALQADKLIISDRAIICFPFHVLEDKLQEEALGAHKFGSTQRGIAPCYGDKVRKFGIQMGELSLGPAHLSQRLEQILARKNELFTKVYKAPPVSVAEMLAWLEEQGKTLLPYIKDAGLILQKAVQAGADILFEAQLGALRDLEYGIYPFTTSSSPLAAYAPIGAGIPAERLDKVIGVVKAYSSCVGEGPFTAELKGPEGDQLREVGAEYGAATGRPRRVGGFDLPATKYGLRVQGVTEIALTKLDILGYLPQIPVCTAYKHKGAVLSDFPFPALLDECEPVYEFLPGWNSDISAIRHYADLPLNCQKYIEYIEQNCGCPLSMISVGPGREQLIYRS